MTAGATALSIGGSTDITVQVLESAGTAPQDGTLVSFTTTLGSLQPFEARTSGGRVVVKFLAGSSSGTATITATSGAASGGATNPTNVAKVAIGAAAAGSVTVTANPGAVPSTGGTSAITATVFDLSGNALGGVPVAFASDNGTLSEAVVNSNAAGQAVTTLTTNKVSKVTVTAGASSISGTTITPAPTANVTVNVNAAPTVSISGPATPVAAGVTTFTITAGATAPSVIREVVIDFGDGSPKANLGAASTTGAGTISVQHVYAAAGPYTATIVATDNNGLSSTASTVIVVTPAPPFAVGLSSTQSTAGGYTSVVFTASVTGGTAASLAWDFGDGATTTTTGLVVNHVYLAGIGPTRTVNLTVTSTSGQTGTAQLVVLP